MTYEPEIWRVQKDTIYAAITAVEAGLDYARELLADQARLTQPAPQTHTTNL